MIAITSFWIKTKVWLDIGGSLATIFCVPVIVASGLVWVSGYGHSASISSRSDSVHAQAGEVSEIEPNLTVDTDSQKIVYQLRLVDLNGNTVYTYPESEVMDKMPKLNKIFIQVPTNIPKGTYTLYTDVKYAKNPIRAEVISAKVAKIEIDD